MGAWIEILYLWYILNLNMVAPFMGAWIEIKELSQKVTRGMRVAPFMGAWIEISPDITS